MQYTEVIERRRQARDEELRLSAELKPHGLTINNWVMLCLVAKHGPMGTTAIATKLGTSLAFVTTSTDKLVYRGLLSRRKSKADNRAVVISVTNKALALLERIPQSLETGHACGLCSDVFASEGERVVHHRDEHGVSI